MNTKIYTMSETTPDMKMLAECADIIKKSGLVAFPTETVYGLGANALDDNACKKIYEAKMRPQDKALLCHICGIEMAEEIAVLNDTARKLIARFTPGPLTVIVPKKQCIGKVVSAGMETVGLRFPSNRICMELIRIAGVPIAAPSANISSFPPPTTGTQTIENLNGRVDAIIDGGATAVGIESTIISLVGKPVILRHGAVSDDEIAEALGI